MSKSASLKPKKNPMTHLILKRSDVDVRRERTRKRRKRQLPRKLQRLAQVKMRDKLLPRRTPKRNKKMTQMMEKNQFIRPKSSKGKEDSGHH